MELQIRKIKEDELGLFASILIEGALWLREKGVEMWTEQQISPDRLLRNNSIGELHMGFVNNDPAAVMILQEEDASMWPEDRRGESLYLHKLCVRRNYAKTELSSEMLRWAKEHAKNLGKNSLKLDCAADRPKLCAFYENQGFIRVGERVTFGKYPTAFYECSFLLKN